MAPDSQESKIQIDRMAFYNCLASGANKLQDANMFIFKEPEPLPRVKTMAERSVRASTKPVKASSTIKLMTA